MSDMLLSLESVTTYYGQMRILEGISLNVAEGEMVCLLGGNASGKSTTLKTIGGIAAAYSRDGRSVISVGPYGRIHHWAAGTNRLLDPAKAKPLSEIIAAQWVVFSKDRRIVAIGDGHVVWLKDTATGQTRHRLEVCSEHFPLGFSPDGRLLATANNEGIWFFNTATGKEMGWVRGIGFGAFSPDGQSFAWSLGDAIAVEDTSLLLAGIMKAPLPAASEPPGVPLQAELIANQKTYPLDLGGLTVEEYAREVRDDQIGYPKLDLTLRLRNTGDRPLRLHSWEPTLECTAISLVGPIAINFSQYAQTGLNTNGDDRKPFDICLKPGATYYTAVNKLEMFPGHDIFWASPGEYRLRADVYLQCFAGTQGHGSR